MSRMTPLAPLQARWAQLAAREKNLLKLAATLVLMAVLWLLVGAPTVATLRTAETQARALDAQLEQMRALQSQAQSLQKQPPLGFDEAVRALNLATKQVLDATAQVNVAGERASVTLQGASADALAQWLAQARLNARSVPVEARLVRGTATPASTAANATGVTWSGVLVMSLPQR
jgi:general secretion pathway protein M